MTPNELMKKICDEAYAQTDFYKKLNEIAETKNKLKCVEMLIDHFGCDFDSARIVIDCTFNKEPIPNDPSDLSPQEIAHNNKVAEDLFINKPKCPTCGSTNISKIGTFNRMISTGFFGLASGKIGKTMKCKNCGYTF